ncbi:vacuolar protein-sorting-associated protein 25 [Chrysoperla carnea]|uniref:vacuolar protein-sorting-associated protein 25 n=1 Tax=Chrysoperla carnea TaxID=189513 RepID=UPI001D07600F|nr:vacuolar protein-sorting-associated protein 25 [Chrysoperla carnea]
MEEVQWPWQYSFPPFFTLQPHLETRMRQIEAWRLLILDYCKLKKQCILDVREATRSTLFHNKTIDRKLDSEVIVKILSELEKTGHAAPCDKKRLRWEIYWHTLPEFANFLYKWANDNGMLNTVCTMYELTNGENTIDEEFYGLDKEVLIKALRILEHEKKCEIIMFEDNEGVKFF